MSRLSDQEGESRALAAPQTRWASVPCSAEIARIFTLRGCAADVFADPELSEREQRIRMSPDILKDRSILISGGTGSFGKNFVANLLAVRSEFSRLVVYSRDELEQYEMRHMFQDPRIRFFIRDCDRMVMAMRGCDDVIHAAALKQVPAAEYNPMECIKTNVHGAENVIAAALENKVRRVMALSTDKAANPINLYGATKLCSDKLFVAANNLVGGQETRFSVTRYGNVVGSRGSVLPLFKRLLDEGAEALPITDERMTRFWITLDEGIAFALQNFARMRGGEIFVPKIPSIRIVDLASAVAPGLSLKFIGIRPGEKLHEVMCPLDDSHLTFDFGSYFVIRPSITFFDSNIDYSVSCDGQKGHPTPGGFEYRSDSNPHFLTVAEIVNLNSTVSYERS